MAIDAEEIRRAAERLAPWVHRTPVLTSRTLDARCGGAVFLKCENFQRVGAFKFRGAMNAVLQLSDAERAAGRRHPLVGQPRPGPGAGRATARRPGLHRHAPDRPGRQAGGHRGLRRPGRPVRADPGIPRGDRGRARSQRHGFTLIHPYDDWRVIAGQGTAAWELLEQAGPLDLVLAPVGGGGLLAGTCLAVQGRSPATRVVGVEPAGGRRRPPLAGEPARSSRRATRRTVADGLRTSLGTRGFSVIRRDVDAIVTATEAEILDAMRFVWERFKIVIEPSGAVPVAPVLTGQLPVRGCGSASSSPGATSTSIRCSRRWPPAGSGARRRPRRHPDRSPRY